MAVADEAITSLKRVPVTLPGIEHPADRAIILASQPWPHREQNFAPGSNSARSSRSPVESERCNSSLS